MRRRVEGTRHGPDDGESGGLPEAHRGDIRLDHGVELDAGESGTAMPVDDLIEQPAPHP
jgi:hypothetical protein